jgi:prophage regulatory protein
MSHPPPNSAAASASQGAEAPTIDRLLRLSDVQHLTGLGRGTIYRWMNESAFPLAVSLGGCRVGWRESDIRQWINSRPTNTQVRTKRDPPPWARSGSGQR